MTIYDELKARGLIAQVTDPKAVLTVDALNKGVVIKKGKKVYHKVTL